MRLFLAGAFAVAFAFAAAIPSGTQVSVRVGQTISSEKAKSGDTWDGTLASDIVVEGKTVARRGDAVTGKVVTADASGRLSGRALLELQIVEIKGQNVVSDTVRREGDSHKGRNAKAGGGGAVLGAIIGGIAGGGKGAAIGAGAGAGAGTAGAAATGKKDITIPVETKLTFRIQ
jgi:hypothetical protein